jgi:type II secretion system protein J
MMAALERRAGFTLIESLVALAITSLIVLSAGALIRDGLFYFDRGTRAVDETEEFALAVDCLTRDFGAARFVRPKGGDRRAASFTADGEGKVRFVTGGDKAPGAQGEEVVEYSVERNDDISQLVRRRAAWSGPRMAVEDADPQDPVIVLKGNFDISFGFSDLTPSGELAWRDEWAAEESLPHSVKLSLRDPQSGVDLLSDGDFLVRANAPMSCDTDQDCLSSGNSAPNPTTTIGAQQQVEAR